MEYRPHERSDLETTFGALELLATLYPLVSTTTGTRFAILSVKQEL